MSEVGEQDRSKVAALYYRRGLRQFEAIRHLSGGREVGERMLERAISLTVDTSEQHKGQVYVAHTFPGGKGKGEHRMPFSSRPPITKGHLNSQAHRKCYDCGGYGHEAKACATRRSECENLIISLFEGKYCLFNTGCSKITCFLGTMEVNAVSTRPWFCRRRCH